jgi:hypothetical protein
MDWLKRLEELVVRFPETGIQYDIGSMTESELELVYWYLLRMADQEDADQGR